MSIMLILIEGVKTELNLSVNSVFSPGEMLRQRPTAAASFVVKHPADEIIYSSYCFHLSDGEKVFRAGS